MNVRSRFVQTALLVLVAFGGAGLAVAADRPHDPAQRPELTWAADRATRPWTDFARSLLDGLVPDAAALSVAGRQALGELQALDVTVVRTALAEGGAAAGRIGASLEVAPPAAAAEAGRRVERWRLSPSTAALLDRTDAGLGARSTLVGAWQRISARATAVVALLDLLARHDAQVFRATTAGRQADWAAALTEMEQARPLLDEAARSRPALAVNGSVETLDDLLARSAAYDDALLALYAYVNETGNQDGAEFERLEAAVTTAQAALPADSGVLSVIVGETAATEIAAALVEIEQARGDIRAALVADPGQ